MIMTVAILAADMLANMLIYRFKGIAAKRIIPYVVISNVLGCIVGIIWMWIKIQGAIMPI